MDQPLSASRETRPRGRLAARERSLLSTVGELLIPSAWAHLPPVNGPIYWVRITVPQRACKIELLTTKTSWTPPADAWALLTGTDVVNKPLSVDAFSTYMQDNRVTVGPYHLSKALTFTVAK